MKEFKWLISRTYDDGETLGSAIIFEGADNIFEFKTLELPVFTVPLRLNTAKTNCIPIGTYKMTKIYSPTKGQCFMVHNVPARTAVLAHKGNYAEGKKVDTQGCILVGSDFEDINKDGNLDITHSTETLARLLSILPNEFQLIII
jgi:hypothetical protein